MVNVTWQSNCGMKLCIETYRSIALALANVSHDTSVPRCRSNYCPRRLRTQHNDLQLISPQLATESFPASAPIYRRATRLRSVPPIDRFTLRGERPVLPSRDRSGACCVLQGYLHLIMNGFIPKETITWLPLHFDSSALGCSWG